MTIPGRKKAYRLVGADGVAMLDFMIAEDESAPSKCKRTLCRHPFDEKKRAYVTPTEVIPLHRLVWDGPNGGLVGSLPSLDSVRDFIKAQMTIMRADHLRPINPTPYKVSVSAELFTFLHDLWMREVPIPELS